MNPRVTNKLAVSTLLMGLAALSTTGYGGLVIGDTPLKTNPQVLVGVPDASPSSIIISRKQYVISWNFDLRTPEWVSWVVNKRALGDSGRSDVFRLDRDLDEALAEQNLESVQPKDYSGTCLDRGHQVPSGDRTSTMPDNQSTFFMSNIMPQSAHLNRRTWVSLERFLRRQVLEQGQHVQIYSGIVPNPKQHAIGPNADIQVPLKNFKIAVLMPASRDRVSRDEMRFFVANFPNTTSAGTDPVTDREQACYDSAHTVRLDEGNRQPYWRRHVSTLDQVERESGIDFSFLHGIHELTPGEIDDLIQNELTRRPAMFPVLHEQLIQSAVRSAVQSASSITH